MDLPLRMLTICYFLALLPKKGKVENKRAKKKTKENPPRHQRGADVN